MEMLEKLNEQQKNAVMHVDGPCLVMAGAGSGKTTMMCAKIDILTNKQPIIGNKGMNFIILEFSLKV